MSNMLFKWDIGVHADQLRENGYVLLKDVLSSSFMSYLRTVHRMSVAGEVPEFGSWNVSGRKQQYVFSLPPDEAADEFRETISRLTGLNQGALTIAERHLTLHNLKTPAFTAPHKDCSAFRYSISIPIDLVRGTSLCLFPGMDRTENTSERSIFLARSEDPDFDGIYRSENAVMVNEELGDMLVFKGSAMFYERVHSAGTAVFCIRMNDEGHDPLGENIYGNVGASHATAA